MNKWTRASIMRGHAPFYTARGALHVNVGQHTHTSALNLRFHIGHVHLWSERGTFIPTYTTYTLSYHSLHTCAHTHIYLSSNYNMSELLYTRHMSTYSTDKSWHARWTVHHTSEPTFSLQCQRDFGLYTNPRPELHRSATRSPTVPWFWSVGNPSTVISYLHRDLCVTLIIVYSALFIT